MGTDHCPRFEMVDSRVADALRALPGHRRLAMVFEMNEEARALLAQGFRSHHPELTGVQVQAAVAERMLHGDD